jgi:N,N-dimethylformamidase
MLQGYLRRLSVRAGGSTDVFARGSGPCVGAVRRLRHSDPHPDGPGVLDEPCAWGAVSFDAVEASYAVGSYAVAAEVFDGLSADSTVFSWRGADAVWALGHVEGHIALRRNGEIRAVTGAINHEREWCFVGVLFHGDSVELFSGQWGRTAGPFISSFPLTGATPTAGSSLSLGAVAAASDAPTAGDLDGRIAAPVVYRESVDVVDLMNEMNGYPVPGALRWDLADVSDPDVVPAAGGEGPAFALRQAPSRSGAVPQPVDDDGVALTEPGSLFLHRDDLEDPDWPRVAELVVPGGVESGCYSLRLECGDETYELPFIVSQRQRVTLLIPTLTWQAYGNLGRDPHIWPGRSHYSQHRDGSPVQITTMWRPCQTFAPSSRLEVDAADGFASDDVVAHLLMADLYADYWLNQQGPHGVIDDRDVHFDGLDGVDVLVLSAHPEYWTPQMLDAAEGLLARGGNVLCLGANAMYWVTLMHPTKPHLIEVRRWAGSQTVAVSPEDRMHQFAPVKGGTTRVAGRPSHRILGVGFSGFGCGPSMEFERAEVSYTPEWSWVFDGISERVFGGDGINTGAGNEYDSYDSAERTAGDSVVLASCVPAAPGHFGSFEKGGLRSPAASVRADVTMTRTPAGGLVFSVSSITASGCLVAHGGKSALGRVCANVLAEMVNPATVRAG